MADETDLKKLIEIEIIRIDTTQNSFETVFAKYKDDFFKILTGSFQTYYGNDYQLKRIIEEQSVIYLATVDNILVGVSYIKKNLRRGGTAVFPEQYRRMGIAEKLIRKSLQQFPKQYTILRMDNHRMLSLMDKVGFKKAKSIQEIERIVPDEFSQFSDFAFLGGYLVFDRYSLKRQTRRERLTLLHTFF